MRVLSLFDGMACGMLAMLEAGIEVDKYVAYEIDKYAVQTSSHNFPMIEHRGDVFEADFTEFEGFDFLVGGSPCTYWSIAQKNNRETEVSGMGWELFSQYVRALHEAKPRWFIYENNKSMSNAIRESITETFGFEPICINSALVSAQNRQRLYWVGRLNTDGTYSKVNVELPEDRGFLLRDVLDGCCRIPEYGDNEKSRPVTYSYAQQGPGKIAKNCFPENPNKQKYDYVAEPLPSTVLNVNPSGKGINGAVSRIDAKSRCLTTNKGEGQKIIVPVGIGYRGRLDNGKWMKQYESNGAEKANAITTAQTDSMVAEPICSDGGGAGGEIGLYAIPVEHMRVKEATKKGYTVIQPGECVDMTQPNSKTRRGRNMAEKSNCLMTSCQYYQYCGVLAYATPCEWDENGNVTKAISAADGKTYPVYEVKDGHITIKGKTYPIKLIDGFYIIRKLTVCECMRLQTVPEWYEFPVSDSQAYKMLGNGWTVDVIAHLVQATQADVRDCEQLDLFQMAMWG